MIIVYGVDGRVGEEKDGWLVRSFFLAGGGYLWLGQVLVEDVCLVLS